MMIQGGDGDLNNKNAFLFSQGWFCFTVKLIQEKHFMSVFTRLDSLQRTRTWLRFSPQEIQVLLLLFLLLDSPQRLLTAKSVAITQLLLLF